MGWPSPWLSGYIVITQIRAVSPAGEFAQYKLALRKLDYLRTVRSLFVGRAIHTAAWETSLETLMSEM